MRYLFADCLLDTQCYLLRRAGQSIQLRPKVFQVLTYLLTHCDRVIPKHELCEQVWSAQGASDTTIETCLRALRQAIGDTGQAQRLIKTHYGHGYRFVAPVAQEDHAQRAVLTALGIQRHLSAWQTARASPEAAALQVRMGLHTGRVAVGDSGVASERGAVVVGETVTRAVALQAYAAS